MSQYYKYNTFFFYNINYLFKLSKNNLIYFEYSKLNYIKKFKNSFRYLLYTNVYLYKTNLFVYFYKNNLKNSCIFSYYILNFSSFKTIRNFFLN